MGRACPEPGSFGKCGRALRDTSDPRLWICPKHGPVRLDGASSAGGGDKPPKPDVGYIGGLFDQPSELPPTAAEGLANKQAAFDQVHRPSFSEEVHDMVLTIPLGTELTGEDIRWRCKTMGIEPHHHNAWGGVTSGLLKEGLIEPMNKLTPMKDPRSNGRQTMVYRRVDP